MQSFVFKTPVSKIGDFSGKRIRVLATEGEQSAVAALGGSAVPMSLPEVLPALQQGTIDGVNSVLGVFVAFRYHDAAPHLVDTALWPIMSLGLVSKVWFDRLPPDLQEGGAGNRAEDRARAREMADRAHRERHQGLDSRRAARSSSFRRAIRRRRSAASSAAAQAVVAKSAPLKDLYDRLKAVTASRELTRRRRARMPRPRRSSR